MTARRIVTLVCALSTGAALVPAHAQVGRHRAAARAQAVAPPAASSVTPHLPAGIGYQVRLEPDTVGVGTPFQVVVRVRAARGATIAFPAAPDSGGSVEALDPRRVLARHDTAATEVAAVYRLAAWDLGRLPVSFGPVTVTDQDGAHVVPLGALTVFVAPTVPARGGAHPPRPARALYPDPEPWWWRWAVGGAVLAMLLVAWLVVRWWRRRRRRGEAPRGALSTAREELRHLGGLGLLEAGEWGRYLTLVAEVVRHYLAHRLPNAPLSSTSGELLTALTGDARVPIDRLRTLLAQTDLIKFAGQPLSREAAQAASEAADVLMADIDAAIVAAEVAAREAAARQTSREFEERRTARAVGSRGRAA